MFTIGDRVRHVDHGWTGTVISVHDTCVENDELVYVSWDQAIPSYFVRNWLCSKKLDRLSVLDRVADCDRN